MQEWTQINIAEFWFLKQIHIYGEEFSARVPYLMEGLCYQKR